LAVAALVLGILGIILCWFPASVLGVPLAVVGLILAIVARKRATAESIPTSLATGGLVVSVIGLVLSAASLVACVACASVFQRRAQQIANDPKFREQNAEFNEAFKKALEEKQKQDHEQALPPPSTTPPPPSPPPAAPTR
jgi:hypothetical protein